MHWTDAVKQTWLLKRTLVSCLSCLCCVSYLVSGDKVRLMYEIWMLEWIHFYLRKYPDGVRYLGISIYQTDMLNAADQLIHASLGEGRGVNLTRNDRKCYAFQCNWPDNVHCLIKILICYIMVHSKHLLECFLVEEIIILFLLKNKVLFRLCYGGVTFLIWMFQPSVFVEINQWVSHQCMVILFMQKNLA